MLTKAIPTLLIACTVGFLIPCFNINDKEGYINVLPIVIPFGLLSIVIGLYRGINTQKALFQSYSLTITNNLITRERINTPSISIYFSEVKEIVKNKNGSFIIRGKDNNDIIEIPAQIDEYSQLEMTLQKIQPIVLKSQIPFFEKYQSLMGFVNLGLMFCVVTVTNKIIVGLSGSLFVTLMVWSLIKIRKSKNVDNKTKKAVLLSIVVIVSIITVVIFKLSGIAEMQKH